MPRNGTGSYSLPAGNPVVTGTVISSTVQNNTMNDLATALTQSIASTGVTTPSANLPMGGFRHTGVGNATALGQYASVTDVQNGSLVTLSAVGGTADAITATAPLLVAAYAAGQRFQFAATGANTGAVTINLNTLGAKAITKTGTVPLVAGDILSGQVVEIVYDGTRFQMIGARQGGSVAALTVTPRSSNTIFAGSDLGSMNQFTNSFTQTFTAAATLGSGWYVDVQNVGTGVITFDANGSETFNTQGGARTTIAMYPGEGFRIVCNGTGFDLVGRAAQPLVEVRAVSAVSDVDLENGFTDTEFSQITVEYDSLVQGAVGQVFIRVKKGGSYLTSSTYGYTLNTLSGIAAITSTNDTGMRVSGVNGNAATQGRFVIQNPSQAARQFIMVENGTPANAMSVDSFGFFGAGTESTASAIQGVRMYSTSGQPLTGNVRVYGKRG